MFRLAYRRLDITNQLVQRARFCAHARMWSRQLVSHSAAQSHIWFSPGRGLGHAPVCVVAASQLSPCTQRRLGEIPRTVHQVSAVDDFSADNLVVPTENLKPNIVDDAARPR